MAASPLLKNEPLGSDDDYSDSGDTLFSIRRRRPLLRKENICWAILFALLLAMTVGISAGVATLVVLKFGSQSLDANSCIKQTAAASPVTRDLDITYHTQQFNGSFMEENIYRRQGSPEVDAAWEALGVNYRAVQIPAEVGSQVGLTHNHVQINEKYGGGFPANVEGLHQLHCVNLVRQALWYNIDYYRAKGEGAFKNEDHVVQKHVSHCLDIVRQQLMCTVDIGVLGQVWWQPKDKDVPEAFVDFNTKHTCRNYEAVRQWAEERQLPEEVPDDFLAGPRPGDRVLDHVP
ncbi:hypothetical protein HII31_11546 [Pseudocercospora fuligena]|uniref:Tat pathway signal sequence n=1 Tax=Pseudocercospora fuligena TaxID=685502 RepID=A0A8H6VDD9_9PEZI|nr:hypothetical protein HII31_11546 [Pseudocercospora fuligena]